MMRRLSGLLDPFSQYVLDPFSQYVIVCVIVVIGLLLLFAGAAVTDSCVAVALSSGLFPLKLPTITLLVVCLAWLTDMALIGMKNRGRAAGWLLGTLILLILIGGKAGISCWGAVPLLQNWNGLSSLLLLAVIFLFLMAATRSPQLPASAEATPPRTPEDTRRDEFLERWAHVASPLIMIIALFAFGLEFSERGGHLDVNWREVPAILIVFVLAELGVTLVLESRRIGSEVRRSTAAAHGVVDRADKVTTKSIELASAQSALAEKFDRVASISTIIASRCFTDSISLCKQLGLTSEKGKEDYWNTLGDFVSSWNAGAETAEGTSRNPELNKGTATLLRVLFNSFIGDDKTGGSVRSGEQSVTCITADAVFAEASEKWLEAMSAGAAPNETTVVWAVSRLLPTEFALPGIWAESVDANPRVEHLERFISSVIKVCRDHGADKRLQYRRVTVFERRNSLDEGLKKDLCNSLDNWMVWDRRVQGPAAAAWHQVESVTVSFSDALLERKGWKRIPERCVQLKSVGLKQLWPKGMGEIGHKGRMLPPLEGSPEHVHMFRTTFGNTCEDGNNGLVLGASKAFQSLPISPNDIAAMESNFPLGGSSSCACARDLLISLGWRSIRDWYCSNLHTKDGDNKFEAWWVANQDLNSEKFHALKLEWNDTKYLSLDVLLIGSRPYGEHSVRWHGAVVSNLSLDRTECTVQLKTGREPLKKIEEVVENLSKPTNDSGLWQELCAKGGDGTMG